MRTKIVLMTRDQRRENRTFVKDSYMHNEIKDPTASKRIQVISRSKYCHYTGV